MEDGRRLVQRKVRVLFGALGWPCGVLEVGSWANRTGLAEVVICQVVEGSGAVEGPEPQAELPEAADAGRPVQQLGHPEGSPAASVQAALRTAGSAFVTTLLRFRPHLVGFRIEAGQLARIKGLVQAVRTLSGAAVVLGGPTATSHPVQVLEETGADYVFAGEAEEPFALFLLLAQRRNCTDCLPQVPGLAYRYGGRVYCNATPAGDDQGWRPAGAKRTTAGALPPAVPHLSRPAAPAGLIKANRLDWSLLEGFTEPFDSLYFTGGRGCPGECTFCARLHGPKVRLKSAAQLIEEIEGADALVEAGRLQLRRWPLFRYVDEPSLRERTVAWAAIYDEDFFLGRRRAIRFFQLWSRSPLRHRYRISIQTNPCSMLDAQGRPDAELLGWIDRLKPMVQLGAESFHPALLARWRKRHRVEQLEGVLAALDATGQDYTVFQLLSDFDSTAEELIETLRLLTMAAFRHPRMRIASSPFVIPLYDSAIRQMLENSGRIGPEQVRHFTDYECPQPGWMEPLTAELAELADEQLQWCTELAHRDAALLAAMEAVEARIRQAAGRPSDPAAADHGRQRLTYLQAQAAEALDQVRSARFYPAAIPASGAPCG